MILTEEIDFCVIGSGPAGQKGAIQASKLGKKTVIIEAGLLGGGSLHTGTIPSKSLREAILDLSNFQRKSFYAKDAVIPTLAAISVEDLNYRVGWVKNHLEETLKRQLLKNRIEVIFGSASFLSPFEIAIYDQEGKLIRRFRAQKVLIAVGSRPRAPKEINFDGTYILTSTQLLSLSSIPRSLTVLGAGIIGTEYASMFALLGTEVTLIDKRSRMLSFLDREITAHLQLSLHDNGVKFIGGKDYTTIEKNSEGVLIHFSDGSSLKTDHVLVAAGREANTDSLDLSKAKLQLNKSGYLDIDDCYETATPGIYAAGDVVGTPGLSSTSYAQGRYAASCAFGHPIDPLQKIHPYGIYTIPEVSYIGKTEEELQLEGHNYEVGRCYFYEISRSVMTGNEGGLCKILFDRKNLDLLGVHIVGHGATEAIHIAQVAISFKAKIEYFLELVFNFPTFAEMYRIAALNGINKLPERTPFHKGVR